MRKHFCGFTLIELLIAMALSSILLLSLGYTYFSTKKILQTQTALDTAQENLRFLNTIFTQSIRVVGYAGCRKLSELNLINHTAWDFSLTNSLRGYSSEHAPSYLKKLVLSGTDVLVIQKTVADVTRVIAPVAVGDSTVKVKQNPALKDNKVLLIADCVNAELFKASNWIGNTINANNNFTYAYAAGVSEVGRFEEIAYFVGATGRVDGQGKPINALFMLVNQGNKQELLSGINSFQIRFGVNDGTIKYYTADEMLPASKWLKVVSVWLTIDQVEIYVKLYER